MITPEIREKLSRELAEYIILARRETGAMSERHRGHAAGLNRAVRIIYGVSVGQEIEIEADRKIEEFQR